jgi:hypothetical protein
MAALNGMGVKLDLSTGSHAVAFKTRRLIEIEKRYGGMEDLQKLGLSKLTEVTAALLWASGYGESDEEAMDAMDGQPVLPLFTDLIVEYVRAYAGDEAADLARKSQDEAKAQIKTNGRADPTTALVAPIPSPS